MFSLRLLSPALFDTSAFSCRTLRSIGSRQGYATTDVRRSKDNNDIEVSKVFTNRNPRALEFMGFAPKIKGWRFQSPRKDYYHKLSFDIGKMYACIQHCSGKVVLDASSKEPEVAKQLYSTHDITAAYTVGKLLSRRMLESGIADVFHDFDVNVKSKKMAAFMSALEENEIQFKEPDEVKFEQIPGVNYDGYNRVGEKRRHGDNYQKL